MKNGRFPAKSQRQFPGVKVVFSEKAFLAFIQATAAIWLIYLQTQAYSLPPSIPEQTRPSHSK